MKYWLLLFLAFIIVTKHANANRSYGCIVSNEVSFFFVFDDSLYVVTAAKGDCGKDLLLGHYTTKSDTIYMRDTIYNCMFKAYFNGNKLVIKDCFYFMKSMTFNFSQSTHESILGLQVAGNDTSLFDGFNKIEILAAKGKIASTFNKRNKVVSSYFNTRGCGVIKLSLQDSNLYAISFEGSLVAKGTYKHVDSLYELHDANLGLNYYARDKNGGIESINLPFTVYSKYFIKQE